MAASDALSGNPYQSFGYSVAEAQPSERVTFIRKTYTHLAVAVYALVALEWAYFQTPVAEWFANQVMGAPYGMLICFGAFMGVSWIAHRWAQSETSVGMQYAGLLTYVFAESIILLPLLWIAQDRVLELPPIPGIDAPPSVNVIGAAAAATLLMFGALSAIAWFSGKDFSFLGAGLGIASVAIFALMIGGWIFGFHLGVFFSVGMIVFASAYILYETSNVMNHYHPGQHVAASLALFAAVALLFYYVLRLLIALSQRD